MKLAKCDNDHFYDADKYSACPHCAREDVLSAVPPGGKAVPQRPWAEKQYPGFPGRGEVPPQPGPSEKKGRKRRKKGGSPQSPEPVLAKGGGDTPYNTEVLAESHEPPPQGQHAPLPPQAQPAQQSPPQAQQAQQPPQAQPAQQSSPQAQHAQQSLPQAQYPPQPGVQAQPAPQPGVQVQPAPPQPPAQAHPPAPPQPMPQAHPPAPQPSQQPQPAPPQPGVQAQPAPPQPGSQPQPAPQPSQQPPPAPLPGPKPVDAASLQAQVNNVISHSAGEDVKTMAFYSFEDTEAVVGWLVCVKGAYIGRSFNLKTGRNSIGRSMNMDVRLLQDPSVSRFTHASLIYEPNKREFFMQAGDSSGLTYLNDELLMSFAPIKANDHIKLGQSEFIFVPCCGEKFTWDDYMQ